MRWSPAAVGCELVAADAVEVAQAPGGGEVLVGEAGSRMSAWVRAWLTVVSIRAA